MAEFTQEELCRIKDALVFEDEDIGELTNDLHVNVQEVMDSIMEYAGDTKGYPLLDIILYTVEQAFKRGYMTGLYHFNETIKTVIEEGIKATA